MPAQQLLLSWKDHNGALVSVFENLLKKNTLVDCTLAAEGQYLKAHKVVLSACSSYFELLFSQESEKNPIVILKDVKFQELEAAVNFMYRGEVEVCEDRLSSFLEVAESLQIKGLGSDGKSQDSKEKVSSVKCSSAKSALTERQLPRKDVNLQKDNAGLSSNVPVDSEHNRSHESSSVHRSYQREGSPVLNAPTSSVESSCAVRKETCRDSDSVENTQQSLALPSLTCSESVKSRDNLIIKTEPDTDTFIEDQLDELKGDFGDDVTMMDDQDDWDVSTTKTMDALPMNQQDIVADWTRPGDQQDFSSVIVKEERDTSSSYQEAVPNCVSASSDGVEPRPGTSAAPVGADWILPDNQQNFSSAFLKDGPGSASQWNQGTGVYDVSASEPSAGTSTAPAGVDNLVFEDNDHLSPASLEFAPLVVGSSTSNVSEETSDYSFRSTSPRTSSMKFSPSCNKVFVRMKDLKRHMHYQRCIPRPVSENQLMPDEPTSRQEQGLQDTVRKSSNRCSFKCSDCEYVTSSRRNSKTHFCIHTGEKPFKCSYCDYMTLWRINIERHTRIHTGERPFKCQRCDNAFSQKSTLIRHLKTHTGEKPFKCVHCDARYGRKSTLVQHIRTHTGEKPFKCDHCEYATAYKHLLTTHLCTHTKRNRILSAD